MNETEKQKESWAVCDNCKTAYPCSCGNYTRTSTSTDGGLEHGRSITREDLINTKKQIDVAVATLHSQITDIEREVKGRLDVLERHSKRWRDLIYNLHLHLSKKDRIAFDKRFYGPG